LPRFNSPGFTWLEVLMVLAITALLAVIAVPPLSDAIARHRLRAALTALTDTLQHAREAALYRNGGTFVCPSANGRTCSGQTDWGVGWISRDGATKDVLSVDDALDTRLTAISTGARTDILFVHPDGKDDARPTNQTLALCLHGKPATAVTLVVAKSGHSHVEPASPELARACGAHHSRNR
jgi:prepilin-type N-terminal cleavage/methylation domain-containing protein